MNTEELVFVNMARTNLMPNGKESVMCELLLRAEELRGKGFVSMPLL